MKLQKVKLKTATQSRLRGLVTRLAVIALVLGSVMPLSGLAEAAQITARKVTLSSSAPSATGVTYTFNFTVPTATVIQSASFDICTAASGTCTTPTGFVNSSSTLASQPTNLGDASGWTVNTSTAGSLRLSKSGNVAAPTGAQTVVFGGITNPSTTNTTFYARMTTYSGAAWTGAIDTGTVASSVSTAIVVTATIDEALTFCTGTSITGQNCGTIAGSAVSLGALTTTSTGSGTSVMAASTNGSTGYAITINGTTLTSGANTVAALAAQTASAQGSNQFGVNLRANTTPSVGANVTGTGTGVATANYVTADQFRFVTGDSVASAAAATNANTFTVSYIANISGAQPAGTYTASFVYIATPTF